MSRTARDLMQAKVRVVSPYTTLPDLERLFFDEKVGGFPVVSDGALVGIVSRSDIVRQLCVEQNLSEIATYYYHDVAFHEDPPENLEEIADRVGRRIENLRVEDVMVRKLLTVRPDQPLAEVAGMLCEHGIHRVLVTDGDRLVGIISSLDLVAELAG